MPIVRRTRRDFLRAAALSMAVPALAAMARAAAAEPRGAGAPASTLDVRACGALGNGRDLDTRAINDAIAAVAGRGGGTVRIPAGDYLCNTLHLRSGVMLRLERGAVIRAAPPGRYDPVEPNRWARYQDYGHDHWRDSLICGVGVENVAISGPGHLCGNGLSRGAAGAPSSRARGSADKVIALKECRNVRLEGFSLVGTAHMGVLATGVSALRISGLLIDTGRDGIDVDCCEDVLIEDSRFNTPKDDSIALKSSAALGYRRVTRNVRIRRCLITGGFAPGSLQSGAKTPIDARAGMKARIKLGTESCWGFENIAIEDCTIWNALGIPLLTVDGGTLRNVAIRGIVMANVQDAPLFLRLGDRLSAPPGAGGGALGGVTVENLRCYGYRMPITISGIAGRRIGSVALRNLELIEPPEEPAQPAGGWLPVEAGLARRADRAPPERSAAYPEPGMFGPLPAKLLFARHVDALEVDGLRLRRVASDAARRAPADERALFWLHDVAKLHFAGIHVPRDALAPIVPADQRYSIGVSASEDLLHAPAWGSDLRL